MLPSLFCTCICYLFKRNIVGLLPQHVWINFIPDICKSAFLAKDTFATENTDQRKYLLETKALKLSKSQKVVRWAVRSIVLQLRQKMWTEPMHIDERILCLVENTYGSVECCCLLMTQRLLKLKYQFWKPFHNKRLC